MNVREQDVAQEVPAAKNRYEFELRKLAACMFLVGSSVVRRSSGSIGEIQPTIVLIVHEFWK